MRLQYAILEFQNILLQEFCMAETIDYPRGLTFEQVWAMSQETSKQMQKTDKQIRF